ncbi:ankyrin repeat domain-containing protein 6 [Oncorhynchus keta]|uniref:ankyrin repeat domain-containing protein 6 n=1 Tax=Oncorhynchus keta TaxID=8018 RepID=UPI00227C278D|nr:ankyrin repeat domain-containing protein 6 [Oncorhynchus keta]
MMAGNTALHLACQNANTQSAHVLLLGGSRPDIKNNVGDTCLHVAARYNHLAMIKILVDALCSVTAKNQLGDTALHVAAALNHKKTVQLLLEAGTDGNARNNAGKTALDKARDYNHKDVSLLLARAPQVHCFTRERTVRKKRDRLKAERRTQSVTREEILPNKDSGYVAEASHGSERRASRAGLPHHHHHRLHYSKTSVTPTSPYHRRRRHKLFKEQALAEDTPRRRMNGHPELHRKSRLCTHDEALPPHNGKTYQLYTLYRDKDGNVKQAPANGCHCKPLIKRLEGELNATKEEMRTQMLTVQEQVYTRLGRMDRKSIHQACLLPVNSIQFCCTHGFFCLIQKDKLQIQPVNLHSNLYQSAGHVDPGEGGSREDGVSLQDGPDSCPGQRGGTEETGEIKSYTTQKAHNLWNDPSMSLCGSNPKQAAATQELKRWCMTQIQDMDLHLPAHPQYYKLLPSPSVEQSVGDDGDSECLPLLSVFSGDSSSSLANYVNLLPCPSPSPSITHNAPHSPAMEQGQGSGRKYFELKLDRSPEDDQNTTLLPLLAHRHHPGILLSSTATRCQHPELLDNHIPGLIWDGCSSSSQSPTSNRKQGRGQDSHGWHHKKHLRDRIRTRGLMRPPSVGTRTLEFFMDRPPEPTFSQERNNLHAMEVTQTFFETVSTQLECWYERKIQNAKRQAELRAQHDRAELLQRIRSLEEELEQLRMTNGSTDS